MHPIQIGFEMDQIKSTTNDAFLQDEGLDQILIVNDNNCKIE